MGINSLKIILMQTVGVTLLPGSSATGGKTKTWQIVTEWNKRLRQEAEKWQQGTIYLFGTSHSRPATLRRGHREGKPTQQGRGFWMGECWGCLR